MKLINLAKTCLTPKGFNFLTKLNTKLPNIWDKPSSSTGKYHKRQNGTVPSIEDHTFEMLKAAIKVIRLFDENRSAISKQNDVLFIAIILHDNLKYGLEGKYKHTVINHDFQMAELIKKQREFFELYFTFEETNLLIQMIRMHSGQWSLKKADRIDFNFNQYPPEVLFIHMLDMLSTASYLGPV